MAAAVCVGGLLQVALPDAGHGQDRHAAAYRPQSAGRPARPWRARILKKMGPALFAVSAAQISLLINTSIAGRAGDRQRVSADLCRPPDGIPDRDARGGAGHHLAARLSKANAECDTVEYSGLLDWGLRLTFLLALPAAVGMATLAEPMIATLFHYGKFERRSHASARR
jgi:putative peptidoglycan lipid II flippase